MRRADVYPQDALTGGCFVTGDYDPGHGIVDLELYVDALPVYGRLCLSGIAVRDMVTALGLTWPSEDLSASLAVALEENDRLRAENQKMRRAVANIVRAAELAKFEDWMVDA